MVDFHELNEDTIETLKQCRGLATALSDSEIVQAIYATKIFEMWCLERVILYDNPKKKNIFERYMKKGDQ